MPVTINGSDGITNASWTTGTRPSNPGAGQMGFNSETNALEFYNPILDEWRPIFAGSINATGGSISDLAVGGVQYRIHEFTSDGTFEIVDGTAFLDVVIVGGGGCGGFATAAGGGGGGGGAGEVKIVSTQLTAGTYPVTVGNGSSSVDTNGEDSIFNNTTAIGGGFGGSDGASAGDGGSGGGMHREDGSAGNAIGDGFGNNGGDGAFVGTFRQRGGGGGGAGAPGVTSTSQGDSPPDGGDGIDISADFTTAFGDNGYVGGGGAGGTGHRATFSPDRDAEGGLGGGADSFRDSNGATGQDAMPNTGGGGSGAGTDGTSSSDIGNGGSGIVLIRYRIG